MTELGEPLVSVITVNYNGQALLGPLLGSLRRQSYLNREIIVVDNGSTDGSLDFLDREFPEVRVLRQTENSGFAGGNNVGIRAARGELVALANNDTVADPEWLGALVEMALKDPSIAAVGSKIVFLRPFLPIHLVVDPSGESGMRFGEESGFLGCDYDKTVFREGFHGTEWVQGRRVRRMLREARVYLPVQSTTEGATLQLVAGSDSDEAASRVHIDVGSTRVATLDLLGELTEHRIEVPVEVVEKASFDLINNAGTNLSPSGEAADRGIYEPDRGQYDRAEDVEAICGAAVLFRRSALREVGLFDRDFFMYYEDTDLSWRLRTRGYRLRYQPRSRIRHIHAASSVEWSPRFTFYTARNKVLMIAKNSGIGAFVRAYGRELLFLVQLLRQFLRSRELQARQELGTRLRVHRSFLWQIPRAFLKRAGWLAH